MNNGMTYADLVGRIFVANGLATPAQIRALSPATIAAAFRLSAEECLREAKERLQTACQLVHPLPPSLPALSDEQTLSPSDFETLRALEAIASRLRAATESTNMLIQIASELRRDAAAMVGLDVAPHSRHSAWSVFGLFSAPFTKIYEGVKRSLFKSVDSGKKVGSDLYFDLVCAQEIFHAITSVVTDGLSHDGSTTKPPSFLNLPDGVRNWRELAARTVNPRNDTQQKELLKKLLSIKDGNYGNALFALLSHAAGRADATASFNGFTPSTLQKVHCNLPGAVKTALRPG